MPAMKLSAAATVAFCICLTGCVSERIIERPVPIQPPSLCLQSCIYDNSQPTTNGELLDRYQAQREALACYESRLQCVREMAGK